MRGWWEFVCCPSAGLWRRYRQPLASGPCGPTRRVISASRLAQARRRNQVDTCLYLRVGTVVPFLHQPRVPFAIKGVWRTPRTRQTFDFRCHDDMPLVRGWLSALTFRNSKFAGHTFNAWRIISAVLTKQSWSGVTNRTRQPRTAAIFSFSYSRSSAAPRTWAPAEKRPP